MLGLDVDGRQHTVLAHAGEQPQPADAGSRADLDDGLRAAELGQHAQQRPDRRGDGASLGLDGAVSAAAATMASSEIECSACVTIESARLVCGWLAGSSAMPRSVEGADTATTATRPRHNG